MDDDDVNHCPIMMFDGTLTMIGLMVAVVVVVGVMFAFHHQYRLHLADVKDRLVAFV